MQLHSPLFLELIYSLFYQPFETPKKSGSTPKDTITGIVYKLYLRYPIRFQSSMGLPLPWKEFVPIPAILTAMAVVRFTSKILYIF